MGLGDGRHVDSSRIGAITSNPWGQQHKIRFIEHLSTFPPTTCRVVVPMTNPTSAHTNFSNNQATTSTHTKGPETTELGTPLCGQVV